MYRVAAVFLVVFLGVVYCQTHLNVLCKNFKVRVGSDLIRDKHNCSIFYSCKHPIPRLFPMSCGFPTVFSQSQQVCVSKNSPYDDCKKSVYGGAYNDPLCRPRPSGLNRDPTDCSRFIPCFNHTSYPSMSCQSGLKFSFRKQRCVEPGKSDCRNNFVNNGNYNNNRNVPPNYNPAG